MLKIFFLVLNYLDLYNYIGFQKNEYKFIKKKKFRSLF